MRELQYQKRVVSNLRKVDYAFYTVGLKTKQRTSCLESLDQGSNRYDPRFTDLYQILANKAILIMIKR